MTASLPVWSTTKAILAYAWSKRALAIRYAIPPVAILLLIDLGGILAGIEIEKNYWWQIVTAILSILVFAPFTVTWFLSIVHGESEVRTRPIFVFAELEKNVVLANIRVLAFVIATSVALLVLILIGAALYAISPPEWLMYGVIIIAAPLALYFWVMALTRVSVVVAYGAAGEPITIREAFKLTRTMAYRMTWTHIILATLAFVVAGCAALLAMTLGIGKGPAVTIALTVVNAVSGFVYLVLLTTLFGFVYRRLKETAVA